MPKLQLTLPDGTELTHELTESEATVGRLADNTFCIPDASVSSNHAVLIQAGPDYILKDIGSTNGSRLNGQQLAPETEHKLRGGDKIRFGQIECAYTSETISAADQRPMPQEEHVSLKPASASVRPNDFSNASPFQKKEKKKDSAGVGIMAFAGLAFLAFLGAVACIFMMKA
jgi:pSer/pThr/pTyr-binding forkhead associated (FHA) protein